jgi:hypothetical protein
MCKIGGGGRIVLIRVIDPLSSLLAKGVSNSAFHQLEPH